VIQIDIPSHRYCADPTKTPIKISWEKATKYDPHLASLKDQSVVVFWPSVPQLGHQIVVSFNENRACVFVVVEHPIWHDGGVLLNVVYQSEWK